MEGERGWKGKRGREKGEGEGEARDGKGEGEKGELEEMEGEEGGRRRVMEGRERIGGDGDSHNPRG